MQGVKQREGRLEEQYKEETSRLGRVSNLVESHRRVITAVSV